MGMIVTNFKATSGWNSRSPRFLGCNVAMIAIAGALACTSGTAAFAQESASTTVPDTGEIVVTAQKREQRLSDVGLTITAQTGEQLQAAGVSDVSRLAVVVPGFSSGQTYEGYSVFSLRGVNFNSAQLSAPPAVSTYVDEATLPYPAMTGGLLLDVERVEVLKGPQGTLFGQNATGGSINVIAAKPTTTLKAGLRTEVNQFGQVMLEGFVSGPLSDTLTARVAANTTQFGAWQRSYFRGQGKNGDQNRGAARLLLDWKPSDRLTVSLNLNGNYDHGEAIMPQLLSVIPGNPANAAPGLIGYPLPKGPRDTDVDPGYNTHKRSRTYQAVGRIDYELSDDLKFTSLTNYADTHVFNPLNQEGTAIVVLQGNGNGSVETINQEVRLTGKVPSAGVNFILGANYGHDTIDDNVVSNNIAYSATPPNFLLDARWHIKSKASGVFGNIDYEVVRGLTLTGGLRYTDTEQTITGCTFANGFCLTGGNVSGRQKQDNLSWRAGVNFKPSAETLVYAIVSRGYKAGLFPAIFAFSPAQIAPVSQEKLTSYEVGTKLSLLDRKLQFNASAFYYDYIDKQFFTYTTVPVIGPVNTIVNIPKSKVKGFDLEVTARPLEGLTLHGGLTYVKTEVGRFSGIGAAGNPIDYTGKEFNFAPPVSVTADAEYRTRVSDRLSLVFGANLLYNDRTFADLGENPDTRLPAYTTVDLRAGVEATNGWRVGVFVRNLADKYYWTSVFNGGDTLVRMAGLARTIGATAAFDF